MPKILFAWKIWMGGPVAALAVVVFVLLLLQIRVANAFPYDLWSSYQGLIPTTETDCDRNDDIETLCQRCAKQTKSNVVYPMCCKNTEEAREWCEQYINFGLQ